jgi:hypothetical protein
MGRSSDSGEENRRPENGLPAPAGNEEWLEGKRTPQRPTRPLTIRWRTTEVDNGSRNSDLYAPLSAIRKELPLSLREGHPMTTSLDEEKRLDLAPEQQRTADLVKHIRKLRWIGMEEEAARLQLTLACFPSAGRAILSPLPRDTD